MLLLAPKLEGQDGGARLTPSTIMNTHPDYLIQPILTLLIRVAIIKPYTPILTFPLKGGRHLNIYCTKVFCFLQVNGIA